jgi:DNA-binding NtrC family response regulator
MVCNQSGDALLESGDMLMSNLPESDPTQAHKNAIKLLAGQRILLAEDEGLIAIELERMLENFGCDLVGPLSSVDQVLEAVQRGSFDGAILDVNLRGRQIFEIMPKLQELGMPIIIASGYGDVTLFPAQFRAMPRLAKPFDEGELRQICETVFGNPAMQ